LLDPHSAVADLHHVARQDGPVDAENDDACKELRCGLNRDLVALVMPFEVAEGQPAHPRGQHKGYHNNFEKEESLPPS
jgi:hypothetical protein